MRIQPSPCCAGSMSARWRIALVAAAVLLAFGTAFTTRPTHDAAPVAVVRESRNRVYAPVRPQRPAIAPKPLRSFSFHTFRYAPNSPVTFILKSSLIWIGTSLRSTLFTSL